MKFKKVTTEEFRNDELLNKHYKKHVIDKPIFDFPTPEDYEAYADKLANTKETQVMSSHYLDEHPVETLYPDTVIGFKNQKPGYSYYWPVTNIFVCWHYGISDRVLKKDGTRKTGRTKVISSMYKMTPEEFKIIRDEGSPANPDFKMLAELPNNE